VSNHCWLDQWAGALIGDNSGPIYVSFLRNHRPSHLNPHADDRQIHAMGHADPFAAYPLSGPRTPFSEGPVKSGYPVVASDLSTGASVGAKLAAIGLSSCSGQPSHVLVSCRSLACSLGTTIAFRRARYLPSSGREVPWLFSCMNCLTHSAICSSNSAAARFAASTPP